MGKKLTPNLHKHENKIERARKKKEKSLTLKDMLNDHLVARSTVFQAVTDYYS